MKELDQDPRAAKGVRVQNLAVVSLNVSNHGLSDQIRDDVSVRFENRNFHIPDDENGSLHHKLSHSALIQRRQHAYRAHAQAMFEQDILNTQDASRNRFYLNGLKAQSSKVFDVTIHLKEPKQLDHFYDHFTGSLESIVEFDEFATSVKPK